jgi:hypothetical protein
MKQPDAQYIALGYKYEKAKTVGAAQAAAKAIRALIEAERIEDRAKARYFMDRGRQEARMEVAA